MEKVRLLLLVVSLVAFVGARIKSPLLDDENFRAKNKAAECTFGKEVLELGSQWIPDLGVPIGVLYCMKCECVPFHRKRRIIARVQCRNIKNECPEPTCDEPELLPGRCCKTCPGDVHNPDIVQDIVPQNALDEEERSSKHYAALLTERSSLLIRNDDGKPAVFQKDAAKNKVVITGRFTFHKRNLYFSFFLSEKATRPQAIQFVNGEGTILEELPLSEPSAYQNATKKVCGVWHRLPRDYRKLLKDERMYVVLVWGAKEQPEFALSGQLLKYVALSTEMFSSLLEPAAGVDGTAMAGSGGTAIVSVSTSVSPSIHLAVVFNGVFLPTEVSDVPIEITLFSSDERKQVILQEKLRVQKPARELNLLEISSPIAVSDLRMLTRGRVMLTVSSVSKPNALKLSGNVMTKITCEIFQTPLTSTPTEKHANRHGVSGLSWLYLNNEGSLVYNVQVDGLQEEEKAVSITLVDTAAKRRTELEDLMTPTFSGGWANGTIHKLGPKVLDSLYSGNLAVNVATASESSLIRGRLTAKLVADARDAPFPVLLKREDYNLPASAVGMAWIVIDNDCHLHYDVYVSGLGNVNDRRLQLYMELLPMIAPGAPVITKFLDEFQGYQIEGSPTEPLTKEELSRFDTGVVFVKVKDRGTRETLLVASLKHVQVPQSCLPSHVTDNDVPTSYDAEVNQNGACLHEGKFYQEEAQWTSTADPCTMCFCQNGNYKCDTMTCPDISCTPNTRKIKVPGECCAVCTNHTYPPEISGNIPRGCTFGGRFYSAGSRFHPFLIPEGFDLCTECVCDPSQLEMKCSRLAQCASYTDTNSAKISSNFTFLNDPAPVLSNVIVAERRVVKNRTAEQVLANGGCKNVNKPDSPYENGAEFHPFIDSLGEYKCITCKCKNSKQEDCTRVKCNLEVCDKIYDLRTMMQRNSTDFCCSRKQCKKYRVKRRNQKLHANHDG